MTRETAKALAALLPGPAPDPDIGRVFVLRLRALKGNEPAQIRLRRLLKTAKRRDGFKCDSPVLEEEDLREEKKEKSKTKRPTDAKRT